MKRFWLLLLIPMLATVAVASYIIQVSPTTGRITGEVRSADSLAYVGVTGALINPVIPAGMTRETWSGYYWTNGAFQLIPQAWLDAESAAAAAAAAVAESNRLAQLKTALIASVNAANDEQGRIIRALAEIVLDSHNAQAVTMSNMMLAVSGATSLANLQTRFALVPNPPVYTLQQLKTAIENKLADD